MPFVSTQAHMYGAPAKWCSVSGLGGAPSLLPAVYFRWTPHPVIVAIGDNRDYIRVLSYSYYITITGWGSS